MAQDKADQMTRDMWTPEEKQILANALEAYNEKIARKANAPAPKAIKDLWNLELEKINALTRKVLQ